jgi:hypothetical protein
MGSSDEPGTIGLFEEEEEPTGEAVLENDSRVETVDLTTFEGEGGAAASDSDECFITPGRRHPSSELTNKFGDEYET